MSKKANPALIGGFVLGGPAEEEFGDEEVLGLVPDHRDLGIVELDPPDEQMTPKQPAPLEVQECPGRPVLHAVPVCQHDAVERDGRPDGLVNARRPHDLNLVDPLGFAQSEIER